MRILRALVDAGASPAELRYAARYGDEYLGPGDGAAEALALLRGPLAADAARLDGEDLDEDEAEFVARFLCDHHVGGPNSVWESGLTDRAGRTEQARDLLRALARRRRSR